MPMPPYPLTCTTRDCGRLAVYKIAARWSDGYTHELKTYALSCEECLRDWFRVSRAKHAACKRASNETLEEPGIWALARGSRDVGLERLTELEQELSA